jgi:hypothetical protein
VDHGLAGGESEGALCMQYLNQDQWDWTLTALSLLMSQEREKRRVYIGGRD